MVVNLDYILAILPQNSKQICKKNFIFSIIHIFLFILIKNCMVYLYNGWQIHYQLWQGTGRAVLLLHGWGRSMDDFNQLRRQFPERTFLAIDFPPFGKSDKNIQGWGIFTYVGMVMSLCEHLGIDSVDVVGHSFGGRVAIILSAVRCALVHSCILIDSAGIKPKRSLKFRLKKLKYKLYKKMGKNLQGFASADYLALPQNMKPTFSNIVETHLNNYAKASNSRTLIVWGGNDQETPPYMAKRLKKYIRKSRLEILSNAGHFCFLDCPLQFFALVKKFWEEE